MPRHIRSAWLKTLATVAAVLLFAGLVGWFTGHLWLCIALGALATLAWHYWRLRTVLRRLTARQRWDTAEEGTGVWNELDRLLYRNQVEMRVRKRRLLDMLRSYRAAAAALPDAVVVLDRNSQRVQWFNEAATALLGLHHPGDLGEALVERLQPMPLAHWLAGGRNAEPILDVPSPVDPAIRGFLDDRPSYLPPVAIDAPVTGMSLGEVVASRHTDWPVGTLVRVLGTWSDHYVITPDALGLERVDPQPGVPLRAYMGALGPVGLTAWVGLVAVGQARPGDTVLVSAAAGATGSTVVQLARAMGCRVVGLAGGADKAALVQRLGADAAIDHRVVPDALAAALDAAAPQGIDVYFDNVGGPLLDLVLPRMREGGRIALCGMIAQYNDADHPHGVTQLWQLVVKRLTLRGFLTYDHADRLAEAQAMLDDLHGRGQLVPLENVHHGFESLPGAFIALMQGQTTGKTLVEI